MRSLRGPNLHLGERVLIHAAAPELANAASKWLTPPRATVMALAHGWTSSSVFMNESRTRSSVVSLCDLRFCGSGAEMDELAPACMSISRSGVGNYVAPKPEASRHGAVGIWCLHDGRAAKIGGRLWLLMQNVGDDYRHDASRAARSKKSRGHAALLPLPFSAGCPPSRFVRSSIALSGSGKSATRCTYEIHASFGKSYVTLV